jgi:hypothetical protein
MAQPEVIPAELIRKIPCGTSVMRKLFSHPCQNLSAMDGPFIYDDTAARSHGAKPECSKQDTSFGKTNEKTE